MAKPFDKRHIVRVPNAHVKVRTIKIHVLAKKGDDFTRFYNVCPRRCLDVAKSLQDDGWEVTGVYAYYTPLRGFNDYEEASPWLTPGETKGLTNSEVNFAESCRCE